MTQMDHTHDPSRRSWIESANAAGVDFPVQNLPFGLVRRRGSLEQPHLAVAIGDMALDLRGCVETGLLGDIDDAAAEALTEARLNGLMGLDRRRWCAVRRAVSELLGADDARLRDDAGQREELLVPLAEAETLLPVEIGDYTDFYASVHHATNVGSMFRPDNPLLPNYKHLPVGYHGRASSIVVSGTPVRRPMGQTKADDVDAPVFGPCRLLDYEMEMGVFTGPATEHGRRVPIDQAGEVLFGMCIVNDWSARDVQKWEYQPLGPFNAKNFATTISPWVVTLEALAPFRVPGPPRQPDDPPVLPYLAPHEDFGFAITVEVHLRSATMRRDGAPPLMLSRGAFADMYWTVAQMLAHHASTGCNFRPGDLLASGTISGPTEDSRGSMLERSRRGTQPLELPDGTTRKFLQDGDEVIMTAYAERSGATRIGFGACSGVVEAAE